MQAHRFTEPPRIFLARPGDIPKDHGENSMSDDERVASASIIFARGKTESSPLCVTRIISEV